MYCVDNYKTLNLFQMLEDFLSPIDLNKVIDIDSLHTHQIGKQILNKLTEKGQHNLDDANIAIIGVEADHEAEEDSGCAAAPNAVRSQLYKLYNWYPDLKLVDIGNIKAGATLRDTEVALKEVVERCLEQKVLPIIIGGTHDLTYGQFEAYEKLNTIVNMVVIDEQIDLLNKDTHPSSESFLYKLFDHDPSYISEYTQVGFQHFLVNPIIYKTLDNLGYDCHRLAIFKDKMEDFEPIVRNSHLISFDMSAICQNDAPGVKKATPNGFTAVEACKLARYSGLSDRVSSIGFYDYNPWFDRDNKTAQLLAQMIWYFIEGYSIRKHEYPEFDEKSCNKYVVNISNGDYELIFLKSKKSERWWMKVPTNVESSAFQLVPCSYSDYLQACREDIPNRWLKAYARMT